MAVERIGPRVPKDVAKSRINELRRDLKGSRTKADRDRTKRRRDRGRNRRRT